MGCNGDANHWKRTQMWIISSFERGLILGDRFMNQPLLSLVLGDIITPSYQEETIAILEGGLVFDSNGKIVAVSDEKSLLQHYSHAKIIDARGHLILPGLIDTHSHVSQYSVSASADIPFKNWIKDFIYPAEVEFIKDLNKTRQISRAFFKIALSLGTTAIATFASSSTEATQCVFEEAQRANIRAFIGKILMDRNAPSDLLEDSDKAIEGLEYLKKRWHYPEFLEVSVNPRFPVVCSEELLRRAGEFANTNQLLFHTHVDYLTSFWPIIQSTFPHAKNALDLFQQMGCMTKRMILAQGTGLEKTEWSQLSHASVGVSHCPSSNFFWSMGLLPVRQLLQQYVLVGLGTDSGGGVSLSLFEVMKSAGDTSKIFAFQQESNDWLSVYELLRMATYNGAKMLGMEHAIGSLEPGKQADFIIVNDQSADPFYGYQGLQVPYQSLKERLTRVIYRNHPFLIEATYINGRQVFAKRKN
jgi:guanine deaminase